MCSRCLFTVPVADPETTTDRARRLAFGQDGEHAQLPGGQACLVAAGAAALRHGCNRRSYIRPSVARTGAIPTATSSSASVKSLPRRTSTQAR